MEAFCKASDSSIAFCTMGDSEKAEISVRRPARDEINSFWEVGDGDEGRKHGAKDVGAAEGYGNGLFCEGKVAEEKQPACDVHVATVNDAFGDGFQVAGHVETDDWVSPRISFSQDFIMAEACALSQSTSIKDSPERKNGEHDIKDNYSAEFAFLKDGPAHDTRVRAKGFMLSADELFFDGKLLPLPFPSIWAASDDLSLSSSCDKHRQELVQNLHNRPMSRHLSFDIPEPSSSTTSSSFPPRAHACISSPCSSSQLGTSSTHPNACTPISQSLPSSAPPLPSAPPSSSSSSMSLPPISPASLPSLPSSASASSSLSPTMSAPSLPSPSVTKCSTKLKDLFRSKRFSKDHSSSQLSKDDSITSTCRLPRTSRSFWPFSRSNSAGVSKSTAPPSLPCRSNSAGQSHTCDAPSPKHSDATDVARLSISSAVACAKEQGSISTRRSANSHPTEIMTPVKVASTEENLNVRNPSSHGADACVGTAESRTMSVNAKSLDFQGHSKTSGKKITGIPGNGSPGKRKGVSAGSSLGKANGGKIMLRNLERCSAEKKFGKDGWRGLHRRGSFPVGARVSPVLNVAVYRGPSTPKIGFFQFNASLFSKKEKPSDAAINWRNGA